MAAARSSAGIDRDRADERYRWRCKLCQLFARQYQPNAARAKLARDYAYNNRKMINEAFDRGVLKKVVLNARRVGFETPLVLGREPHEAGISPESGDNLSESLGS